MVKLFRSSLETVGERTCQATFCGPNLLGCRGKPNNISQTGGFAGAMCADSGAFSVPHRYPKTLTCRTPPEVARGNPPSRLYSPVHLLKLHLQGNLEIFHRELVDEQHFIYLTGKQRQNEKVRIEQRRRYVKKPIFRFISSATGEHDETTRTILTEYSLNEVSRWPKVTFQLQSLNSAPPGQLYIKINARSDVFGI